MKSEIRERDRDRSQKKRPEESILTMQRKATIKNQTIINAGVAVMKKEPSYIVSGNVN